MEFGLEEHQVAIYRDDSGKVIVDSPSILVGEPREQLIDPNLNNDTDLIRLLLATKLREIVRYFSSGESYMYPSLDPDQNGLKALRDFLSKKGFTKTTSELVVYQAILKAVADDELSLIYSIV